jgi:hypothetical protein
MTITPSENRAIAERREAIVAAFQTYMKEEGSNG